MVEVSGVKIEYRPSGDLPDGVPAMVVDDGGGRVVVLVSERLSLVEACGVLGRLVTDAANTCGWRPRDALVAAARG